MNRLSSLALSLLLLLVACVPSHAQFTREMIQRGKKATALVEVTFPGGKGNGSAFCIDKSGLFITNSHVVGRLSGGKGQVHLVLDSGLETHRSLVAKVLRADDRFDLALLKVEAGVELTSLEFGKEDALYETAPILTLGFPFGRELMGNDNADPEITVLTGRITSLKKPKGRLEGVQFDGQLNPGNSGGPVLDDTGRVIGVAVKTVRGASINMAIPVGRLSEFLTAPGLVFEPPPLNFNDRAQPVTWKIRVQPSTPGAKLPEPLSVQVTIANGDRDRRSVTAQPVGDGVYEVKVTPVPHDQPTPTQVVEATVEAKQGSKVLATVQKRAEFKAPPTQMVRVRVGNRFVLVPARPGVRSNIPQATSDEGLLDIKGALDVDGVPRGAGKAIRPPKVAIGEARVSLGSSKVLGAGAPLVHTLGGKISDVADGGGGRFLFLSLKEKRVLAVFEANEARIVKTISLPSDNFLVAAGASLVFIVFPDDKIVQRWDIATMTRQGETIPLPIKARLKGLVMGNDSDGPLLAVWSTDSNGSVNQQSRFSFIDPKTFKVLKAGPITTGGFQGIGGVSPSGGSFTLHPFLRDRVHIRASAGGDLFGIWQTNSLPSGFQTLSVRKGALRAIYNHEGFDHLAPGPDGLTIYTGRGGALDADGKPAVGSGSSRPQTTSELAIPSSDPAYYLSIQGLSGNTNPRQRNESPSSSLAASVHAACDGARLLSVGELNEMGTAGTNESFIADDFTVDKRFHLIPPASLLITIPYSNDRLVLRRLDIGKALDQLGSEDLLVTSPSTLFAEVGKALNHQIEARSKAGGIRYELTRRLAGVQVSSTGMLTWLPESKPAAGDFFEATVRIVDSSGQTRTHELKIRVSEAKTR